MADERAEPRAGVWRLSSPEWRQPGQLQASQSLSPSWRESGSSRGDLADTSQEAHGTEGTGLSAAKLG